MLLQIGKFDGLTQNIICYTIWLTSGARYPGVPSGRIEANLINWSVGSFILSPGTVPDESKSPSLT